MTSTEQARAPSRRDEIVVIAKNLFAEKGYAATSTRDIAEACGLLPGSLYSHFRSKAQILEMIIAPFSTRLVDEQRAVLAAGGRGADRLEAMIRRVVALCADHAAEIRILHYDWPHVSGADDLHALVVHGNETLDLWLQVLAQGVEDGSLRATMQPELAVRAITSTIHGVLDRQRYGTRPDLSRALGLDALADEVVAQLTRGLRV
ncbi:MAG TPA: TetR/AcrR family transcriptional regulator [Acidimicrobiia bacterium]|nr:TetR/AcrR family transcriptional regulator [Acidimicrobiia bacterium]